MENPFVLYQRLLEVLKPRYDSHEARAIALWVLEDVFSLSQTDVYIGKSKPFSADDARKFDQIQHRLSAGEPVQYVLGHTTFMGVRLSVRPGVLIPRPETEDLVEWIVSENRDTSALRIVDCGTGSGCIAIALKLLLPQAVVEAWDISSQALEVATENARSLGADVVFRQMDMALLPREAHRFDLCVSNPPYVLESEQADMEAHVLRHEPSVALFVPDDDALRFYRPLAQSGLTIYAECNSAKTDAVRQLFQQEGYSSLSLRNDRFGLPRMIKAQ